MKNILILIPENNVERIDRISQSLNKEGQMIIMDERCSIFQIDNGVISKIHPQSEKREINDQEGNKESIQNKNDGARKEKKRKKPLRKYPKEMRGFIIEKMESNSNKELCEMINQKWDLGIIPTRLSSYMNFNNLKRDTNFGRKPKRNSTRRKALITKENENKYDMILNGKAVPREVLEFVEQRKDSEDLVKLRDELIIMFELNYKQQEIRAMQNQFKSKKATRTFIPEEYD